jgi:glycerol-3-phosphate dehydrogenase subunit C
MMVFDPHDPLYWKKEDLNAEFKKVLDVCNGCRLCDGLCPPFVDVFDRIDAIDDTQTAAGIGHENPVEQLTKADYKHVVDYCYQCKLCYPKCPYTPPHEYMLDFPRLLLRAQAIEVKAEGKSPKEKLRDAFLGDADRTGAIGATIPGIMNWASHNPTVRSIMQTTIGIHKDKKLPIYYGHTFREWADERPKVVLNEPADKVALFFTCMLNNNKPWIGKQFVEILEANNVLVIAPEQECCGMPELGTGDVAKTTATVDRNIARLHPIVKQGYKIIAMSPSCSLMLRDEYENYATNKEAAKEVKAAILDPMEYLMKLNKQKLLKAEFPTAIGGQITYHLPCHLKFQNIGYPSRDLLKLLPNNKVTMIQQCSGHDGSWSMKTEYFPISLEVGKKLFKAIEKEQPNAIVVSDCVLSHLHIEQGTNTDPFHPIEVLYHAMGFTTHTNPVKSLTTVMTAKAVVAE